MKISELLNATVPALITEVVENGAKKAQATLYFGELNYEDETEFSMTIIVEEKEKNE